MNSTLRTVLVAALCLGASTLFTFFSCEKEAFTPRVALGRITATNPELPVEGKILFTQQKDGSVTMDLNIVVPSKANQSVAVHLHEHGDCGNAGNNTHGHWNPTGEAHGKWGEGAFHSGDIGNISLNAEGKGRLVLTSKRWSVSGTETTNVVGRGVIVHAGVDDYTTQPTGASGARIGCGVIEQKK